MTIDSGISEPMDCSSSGAVCTGTIPTSVTTCSTISTIEEIRPMRSPSSVSSIWCRAANMAAPVKATRPTDSGDTGEMPMAVSTASTAMVCTTAISSAGASERSATCHIGSARSSRLRRRAGSSRKVPKAPSHSASAVTKGKVAVSAPFASFCRSTSVPTGAAAISPIRVRSVSE